MGHLRVTVGHIRVHPRVTTDYCEAQLCLPYVCL